MSWRSGWPKTLGRVGTEAIRTYFVPLAWLTAVLKLWEKLPLPWLIAAGIGLVAYVSLQLYVRVKTDRTRQKRLDLYESLVRILQVPAHSIDRAFTYHTIHRSLYVSRPNATTKISERGRNTSNKNQNELVRLATGDSPIEFNDLRIRAWLKMGQDERELAVEHEPFDGGHKFLLRLKVNPLVIRPNDEIECRWEFTWPGSVARNHEYWVFPTNIYANPIGQLRVDCYFEEVPAHLEFVHFLERDEEPLSMSGPDPHNDGTSSWHKYTVAVTAPQSAHLLRWRYRS